MNMLSRKSRLILNTSSALANQLVTVICGIILPRLYITSYGSEVNGLLASIAQFVSIIAFLELGVGAVVQASLYKPLAKKDIQEISAIVVSSNRFFRKIGSLLLIYSFALFFIYPLFINPSYPFFYSSSLIAIIALGSFVQYYFGITYQLLLNADQLAFVSLFTNIFTTILNTAIVFSLVKLNQSIQVVKLVSSLIFLARPIVFQLVVRKRYSLNLKIKLESDPIKQKWNGIAQHVAAVVLNGTDIIVLTLFSSNSIVSVYSVYFLVVSSIKNIVFSLSSGILALFGNLLSNSEISKLNSIFHKYEWLMHTFVVLVFSITGILIIPFIRVYTFGITDFNYIYPAFGILLTMAYSMYCLRLPYNQMVLAAGHFKETQNSAISEALINVFISVILVKNYGLVGVAVGTLCAMIYRTIYLAWYLSKNIIEREIKHFIEHLIIDIISVVVMILATRWIVLAEISFFAWVVMAIKITLICVCVSLVINLIFYPQLVTSIKNGIKR